MIPLSHVWWNAGTDPDPITSTQADNFPPFPSSISLQVDRWHPSCGSSSSNSSGASKGNKARGGAERNGRNSSADIIHRDGDGDEDETPPRHRHDKQR